MEPIARLDPRYSDPGATRTEWSEGRKHVEGADLFWISTVRPDGHPHVTPLIAVWLDEALYFCTGESERKARNLERNPHCVLTTGCNRLGEGLDLVLEGDAVRVRQDDRLRQIAEAYVAKYGPDWGFTVRDGQFHPGAGESAGPALVFELKPVKAFGFRKGREYSQTRWVF